jgi:hypothetical protein
MNYCKETRLTITQKPSWGPLVSAWKKPPSYTYIPQSHPSPQQQQKQQREQQQQQQQEGEEEKQNEESELAFEQKIDRVAGINL